MISRFKQTLDTLFAHIPDVKLAALNIGNEHDVFMGTDASQYAAYKTFLDSVSPYAKQKYMSLHGEELKIGTTFTLHSLIDPNLKALCKSVNQGLDIVTTTYYPLNSDFTMKDPSVVGTDFESLVNEYSDTTQPIYFAECGYSSGSLVNSSEQKQADFYTNIFAAWDDYKDNIKYLTIFKSTDWSMAEVQVFKDYYGISDPKFLEYLQTLGVRTWDGNGSNKLAYEVIKCELAKRRWCDVSCELANVNEVSQQNWLTIYPNPTHNKLTIETKSPVLSIAIYNAYGQRTDVKLSLTNLDVSKLSSGLYTLEVETEEGLIRRSFLKK